MMWRNGRVEVEHTERLNAGEVVEIVKEQVERTSEVHAFHDAIRNHQKAESLFSFMKSAISHHWDGMVYLQSLSVLDKETVTTIEAKVEDTKPNGFVEQVLLDGVAHYIYVQDEFEAGYRVYRDIDVLEVYFTQSEKTGYLLIESSDVECLHVILIQENAQTVYKGNGIELREERTLLNDSGVIPKITKSFNHKKGFFSGMEAGIIELCHASKNERDREKAEEEIRNRTPLRIPHDANSNKILKNWQMAENLRGYQQIHNELVQLIEETLMELAELTLENDFPTLKKHDFGVMLFKRHSIEDLLLWNPESEEDDMLTYFGQGYERHFLLPPAVRCELPDSVLKDMNRKYPKSLYRNRVAKKH